MPRPSPANRTDFKFLSSLPTRWMDNDQYGHMNNVVHYSLFDTAVSNWQMAQGGFNVTGEITKLMVVESGCRYFDEAGYPDLIHVGLRLGHLGNSSWRYDLGLFRNEIGTAFAEGFFAQVQVDAKSGRPTPVSPDMRAALERLR